MDKLTAEQWEKVSEALSSSFQDSEIDWRVGATTEKKDKCMPLGYLDARAVMDRLDAVVGPQNWSDSYRVVVMPDGTGRLAGLECTLTVCGVTKADVGTISSTDPVKGAYSDALKRAASRFGVGRYLYSLENEWVAYTGNKYKPFADQSFKRNHWNKANASAPWPQDRLEVLKSERQRARIEQMVEQVDLLAEEVLPPGLADIMSTALGYGNTLGALVKAAVDLGWGDEQAVVQRLKEFGANIGQASMVQGARRVDTTEELQMWAMAAMGIDPHAVE